MTIVDSRKAQDPRRSIFKIPFLNVCTSELQHFPNNFYCCFVTDLLHSHSFAASHLQLQNASLFFQSG